MTLRVLDRINLYNSGLLSFYLGIFLLFSAPAIAVIFFLISLIISLKYLKRNPFKDKINIILLVITFLMLFSCISYQLFNNTYDFQNNFEKYTHPLISLFNWIPLFFSFFGFQFYLSNKEKRKFAGIALISGTIPVLVSGIGQYIFNWYGPFEAFNGFIIWYQRSNQLGLTSLFNNQNYAGCALATAWPFFFAAFFNKKINFSWRFIAFFLNIVVVLSIFFTTSRNSIISLIFGFIILLIPIKFKNIFAGIISFLSIIFFSLYSKFIFNLTPSINNITIFKKFNYENLISDPRLNIWRSSFKYIFKKPFLGWGGNSFSSIWNHENNFMYLHSHSLPLELSIQYGIFTTFAFTLIIIFLFHRSFKKIFFDNKNNLITFGIDNHFERAWFASSVAILFSNTIDILYFDLRISILMWILLAGLRSIIREKEIIYEI